MLEYEISIILHTLWPYLSGVVISSFCIVIGILIDRAYWKPRIYRYADREIVKTLEYQKNKISQLEEELKEKNSVISELKGIIKVSRMAALKIIGVVK